MGFWAALATLLPVVGCAGDGEAGVAGAAVVANGGESNANAGNGDAGGSPTCYRATGTASECAALELCSSAIPAIHVDPSNCQPGQCAWNLQPNAGYMLSYENDQGVLFFRFAALPIPGSSADWRVAFEGTNLYAKFPVRGGSSSQEATYFETRTNPDDFDAFEFVDGRFHARLSLTISNPSTSVLAASVFCGDTNSCPCTFAGPNGAATVFDVDLPIATQ